MVAGMKHSLCLISMASKTQPSESMPMKWSFLGWNAVSSATCSPAGATCSTVWVTGCLLWRLPATPPQPYVLCNSLPRVASCIAMASWVSVPLRCRPCGLAELEVHGQVDDGAVVEVVPVDKSEKQGLSLI